MGQGCHSTSRGLYILASAGNGNLEVSVFVLKAKQGHAVMEMEKDKWI
jgi:hypothetical protein